MGAVGAYLTLYNAVCLAGWAWINFQLAATLIASGPMAGEATWSATSHMVKVMQSLAALEFAHALAGVSRSNVGAVFLQCTRAARPTRQRCV